MDDRRDRWSFTSILLVVGVLGAACVDSASGPSAVGVAEPVFSVFDGDPQDLPGHVGSALAEWEVDPHEAFFVTEASGVRVWTARSSDGDVCILYEYVERTSAVAATFGATCGLDEHDLAEAGGALIYAGVGSGLVAVGIVVDGYDETLTSGGSTYPVENNGFIVPLQRVGGASVDPAGTALTDLEFENFVFVRQGEALAPGGLLQPEGDALHR